MTTNIDEIKSELQSIEKTIQSLRKKAEELHTNKKRLEKKLYAIQEVEKLTELIGVQDAVVLSHLCSVAKLRGQKATVLKVNRTRATVSVIGEEWNIPFDLIKTDEFTCELERSVNAHLIA